MTQETFPGLGLYSRHTDPAQNLVTAAAGSTVDGLDYLDYLDGDLSEVSTLERR